MRDPVMSNILMVDDRIQICNVFEEFIISMGHSPNKIRVQRRL